MEKVYQEDEIRIIRQAFSGMEGKGLLQQIVDREYEKNRQVSSDKEALIVFYNLKNCPHIALFVEDIVATGLLSVASASIDFLGVALGHFSIENARTLQSLKIGDKRMSALAWLTYLSFGFDELHELHREALDLVCKNFTMFVNAQGEAKEVLDF